ncbi:MAG: hypothetical protein ACI4XL_13490 [Bacillus sp. (in: firmicutes)]
MKNYYFAVTYEVCKHNDIYMDMNEYKLDSSKDMDQQLREIAKADVAPLIKVYESDAGNWEGGKLYKEYTFKEYECGCGDHLK